MLTLTRGNLLQSKAEALVNTVNTVGVMGKGLALQFKKAFPDNFHAFENACKEGVVQPGRVFVFEPNQLSGPKYIINFPTKRHWRDRARIDDLAAGLNDLVGKIESLGIRSIAVPPLGCGNGGLSWKTVYPLIEEALGTLEEVDVQLFEPGDGPSADEMLNNTTRPRMTEGRAAFLLLMQRYLATGWEYRLSLLELQKLAYFLQELGQPLRLSFRPLIYGPYADELRHVLNRIEGHFTKGFADGRNKPQTPIEPMPDAVAEAQQFACKNELLHQRLDAVTRLIENFESPFGMELLSSVHWVAVHGLAGKMARSADEATSLVHIWNQRKARTFERTHIELAWHQLRGPNAPLLKMG